MRPSQSYLGLLFFVLGNAAHAQSADLTLDIDVVARQLDAARQAIQPNLGASSWTFGQRALADIPQGPNAPLNQVMLRAPGVANDSFGQLHVRGDHANLQYRLNGVQLPEGLSLFGQTIQSRFAREITLLTGSLPAQYGFLTAGVIDIQTKTGITDPGGEISVYGGSWNWLQPSISYGGRSGPVDWYVTADFLRNDRGIENPTAKFGAIHDTTNQLHGLAYVSGIVDPDTRISLILGGFDGQFQIPNNPGQPTNGFLVRGTFEADSGRLRASQREQTAFSILSLQKHTDAVDLQISAYSRASSLRYSPDWMGELLFNGIAQQANRSTVAHGIQTDASWRADDKHTIRFGFMSQVETTKAKSFSDVLPLDPATGLQTTDTPLGIPDSSRKSGGRFGLYIQDEWRILPTVTLNAGLRFDGYQQYGSETDISPRANVVWKPTESTTLHLGYAHYFVPPPFALVSSTSIAKYLNTSGAAPGTLNDRVRAERSEYFDIGISQVVLPGLTLSADYYYKVSRNLLDEGQFGAPIVQTPFNYAKGTSTGVTLSASYDRGPWSAWFNVAYARSMGKNIVSSQFNFDQAELDYIRSAWVHLDHDQKWTGSAGISYTLNGDTGHATRLSVDAFVQSGLRASTGAVPNGVALPTYGVVNLSWQQKLTPTTEFRLDVLNVGDAVYQIRDGSGIGVGAPQFGLRRTILAGLTQRF